MRVLFISGELTGSGLCLRLISEGNELKLYIHKESWKDCYTGIAEKTEDWKSELNWVGKDGLIIFDDVIFGEEQDWLRSLGYTVVGGSKGGDFLEINRKFFQDILKGYGMDTLRSYNFNDADEAMEFVKMNPARWVLKQSSHLSSINFIGASKKGNDVLKVLERYKKRNISPIHIQEYAEGIEVGVARYFNGKDWVGPIEINHEHKNLSEGNIGPLTPEMGTVLWYTNEEIPLFTETLAKLKPYLSEIDFHGDFDINFIVNKDKLWPLEATPRFGAPSTQIQIALHKSPWTDFLSAVGKGNPYNLDYRTGYGIAISAVVDPFPYEPSNITAQKAISEYVPIEFSNTLSEEDLTHIHFEEVSKIEDTYYWSGNYGLILHVTAHDSDFLVAKNKAYERMNKINIPGMYYRKDIGEKVHNNDITKLKEWGWI